MIRLLHFIAFLAGVLLLAPGYYLAWFVGAVCEAYLAMCDMYEDKFCPKPREDVDPDDN